FGFEPSVCHFIRILENEMNRRFELYHKGNFDYPILNSKQTECMIFGGGIGCIDSLYIPGEDRREGSEESQDKALKIQQSVNKFLRTETGGWALAFGIAILFLVLFFCSRKRGD
ncbi:MAG: hypothetical protein WBA74_22935, partial [Cyclobacteriaceae bacterium]